MVSRLGSVRDPNAKRLPVKFSSPRYARVLAMICGGLDDYNKMQEFKSVYLDKPRGAPSEFNNVVSSLEHEKYIVSTSIARNNARRLFQPNWKKISEAFIDYLKERLKELEKHDFKRVPKRGPKKTIEKDNNLAQYSPKLIALMMKGNYLTKEEAERKVSIAIDEHERIVKTRHQNRNLNDGEERKKIHPIQKEYFEVPDISAFGRNYRSMDVFQWDSMRPDLIELMQHYFRTCHPDYTWNCGFPEHFKILEEEIRSSALEIMNRKHKSGLTTLTHLGGLLAMDRPAGPAMMMFTLTKNTSQIGRRKNGKTEKK